MTRTELIAALGAAEVDDTAGHIELFMRAADDGLDLPADHDFRLHVSQAIRAGSDARAQRYLLCAALSVMPARLGWSINADRGAHQALIFRAGDGVVGRGDAATPALALILAILRASGE